MSDDAPLKSAYELAMERLREQDRAEGIESKPLTQEQKDKIAERRAAHKAELARLEIMRKKELAGAAGDPTAMAEIEEHFRRDRSRAESSLESAIARVRRGEPEDED